MNDTYSYSLSGNVDWKMEIEELDEDDDVRVDTYLPDEIEEEDD